jgi:glycosyltransferase involved in cell wall biosynthesis
MAPRPTFGAKPAAPLIVAGTLHTASGLGRSARLCHDALGLSGLPVHGVDLTLGLMQPVDRAEFAFADGRGCEGPGTLILHINSPLVPLAQWRLGSRLVRDKYIVGYWAWELPEVPPDWRVGVPFVHEIWVPSRFTADAVRPIAGGRPVRVVPHPVACGGAAAPTALRGSSRPFTVLTVFNAASSVARKNPLMAVHAFRLAFGNDATARLVVKASNASTVPGFLESMTKAIGSSQNITLVDHVISEAEVDALYQESDVVLSLHRSEGFGLTIAEGMVRGLPVVATDWSGNVDFLTGETGFPVPYRLVPAIDPQHTYHFPGMSWAEADVDAATDALRRLRTDSGWAVRLGQSAAAFAHQEWSMERYAKLVCSHLGLRGR